MKDLLIQKDKVIKNTRDYFVQSHAKTAVLGLSGGVDSAVSAAILKETLGAKAIKTYFIDIHSLKEDFLLAKEIAATLGITLEYVDLSPVYEQMQKTFDQHDKLALGNIKSRLRAVFLYDAAFKHHGLVCGTSNLDELYVGYFTKFGDSANDYPVLSSFIKQEIYSLAKFYQLPEKLLTKAPSAGLVENQTDEQDLGFSYAELDKYLDHQMIDENIIIKINTMWTKNRHKLSYNYNINKTERYRDPWAETKK